MYCQECGAKNDDCAAYCEECGALLEQKASQQTPLTTVKTVKTVKPKRKVNVVITAELIVLIVLSMLCYRQINRLNNPENLVRRYMDAILEEDWAEAYSCLNLPEENAEYLTLSGFAESALSEEFSGITNYTIVTDKNRQTDEAVVRSYVVNYHKRGSTSELTMRIPVMKGRKRHFLILDDWKILEDNNLVMDTMIHLPRYSTVSLDGHMLEPSATDSEVTIPYLFKGKHVVEISMEGAVPYSQTVSLKNDNTYLKLELPYLTETTVRTVGEKSLGYWKQLLEYIVNPAQGQPDSLSGTADLQKEIEEYDVGGYDSYLTAMDLSDITVEVADYEYDSEEGIQLEIYITGTLNRKAQLGRKSWFRNQITYEEQELSGTARLKLLYNFDGSDWKLEHLSSDI